MKYLKYIFRNATRNKLRTGLTALSLAISLAMMTVLYGFITLNDTFIPELARAHRMIIMSRDGFTSALPITVLDHVRQLPGVQAAIPLAWYMGMYKDEKMMTFAQLATDPDELMNVWTEFRIDPAQLEAFRNTRNGCIIDRRNADRRGWRIGEHIPLKGNNYEVDLDLTLVGIYDGPEFINDLYFHYDYLDELLRQARSPKAGTTSILFVKAASGDVIPGLCSRIDDRYANSDSPTLSQSHEAFAQSFAKFVGNIQRLVRNIGLAVIISLTLVAANAMAMSMRERTTEIAVLKAIGFQRWLVLAMILGESVLVSLAGGLFGVGAGRVVWWAVYKLWPQFIPIDRVAAIVLVYGVAVAVFVGIASGIVPAVRAAQLSVISGLRKVV